MGAGGLRARSRAPSPGNVCRRCLPAHARLSEWPMTAPVPAAYSQGLPEGARRVLPQVGGQLDRDLGHLGQLSGVSRAPCAAPPPSL